MDMVRIPGRVYTPNEEQAMNSPLHLRAVMIIAAASIAMASTSDAQLISHNVVGYVKCQIPSGGIGLVRADFDAMEGGPLCVTNLIAATDNRYNGTVIYFYDSISRQYVIENKSFAGWGPGTNMLPRGRGFWLKAPHRVTATNFDYYFMGNVPEARATTTMVARGFNLIGYPYPADITWTNTRLSTNRGSGQLVYLWNSSNQAYTVINYSFIGWAANPTIHPGEGFWYVSTNNLTWIEPKPYTFP